MKTVVDVLGHLPVPGGMSPGRSPRFARRRSGLRLCRAHPRFGGLEAPLMQKTVFRPQALDFPGLLLHGATQARDFRGHLLPDAPVLVFTLPATLMFLQYPESGETFEVGAMIPMGTNKVLRRLFPATHQRGSLTFSSSQLTPPSFFRSAKPMVGVGGA